MEIKIIDIDEDGNILVEDDNTIYEIDGKCLDKNKKMWNDIIKLIDKNNI